MHRRRLLTFASIVLALLILSSPAVAEKPPTNADLSRLVDLMSGSFSSEAQAAGDESYFDIRLEMVPIWTERTDGHWLYVEQAAATSLEKPYRQRVYHVTARDDGSFESKVFEMPEPLRFAGHYSHEKPLAELGPEDLIEREGCSVILRLQESGEFVGSTVEKECKSSLRGATYATSEITIGKCMVESWDRGFDAEDAHVWGAEKGPYLFLCKPVEG